MDIKKSLRSDVFFPVKKNFQFLREQGKTFLKEAYLLGLFIRLFVLFYYTKAGMYAFSQPLLTAGWTEVPALVAGGAVALLLLAQELYAARRHRCGGASGCRVQPAGYRDDRARSGCLIFAGFSARTASGSAAGPAHWRNSGCRPG